MYHVGVVQVGLRATFITVMVPRLICKGKLHNFFFDIFELVQTQTTTLQLELEVSTHIDTIPASTPHQKPRPDGLALAFRLSGQAKSRYRPLLLARLGPAYLGWAWPGSRPKAGPSTPLGMAMVLSFLLPSV